MTTHKETHNEQHNKTYSSKMHSSKHKTPRTSVRLSLPAFSALRMLAVLLLGSLALALACAPAVEGSGHSSAPAPTGITEDEMKKESTSFVVRWETPTGTTPDATPLDPENIGYRIYYLAETADQTTGQTTDQATPSAESITKNPDTQTREVTGVLQARIIGLKADTRYFVTIASYDALASEPVVETASSEVIVATTSTAASKDLDESLSYGAEAETTYEFGIGLGGTITPDVTPSIPGTDTPGTIIRYSLERIDGTVFDPDLAINSRGVITIDSTTSAGSARYFVRAEATDYTTQTVMLTITIAKVDFEGRLAYASTAYEFPAGTTRTITPDGTPSIPGTDSRGTIIRYSLEKSTGAEFDPMPSIAEDRGIIMVNPINTTGTATYTIQASADTDTDTYNAQEVTVTITIVVNPNTGKLQVSTYYNSETTYTIPVELGQAIADDSSTFVLANDDVVLTISDLKDGEHRIHFGSRLNNYDEVYTRTATDGVITILKSDLGINNFSFAFRAVIGISGPDITGTEHIASYVSSNIYDHHDLQAIRKNLDQDYVLKRDIVFPPPAGESASNYEAVGSDNTPFTGSLDGAGYTITGIQIESAANYQGIFGVMEAGAVETEAAQNLVLRDFKITGNAVVGSLAGWIKQGTIDNVRVEVSNADAGKVELSGNVDINGTFYGYGGGLLGRAGTGATDTQVKIQNTSSEAVVSGTGTNSNQIGGLVGSVGSDVVLTESYATGDVTGKNGIGGLVGSNVGTVTGYATGDMIATDNDVGGLVGINVGTVTGYATGDIVGQGNVGGLVGANDSGTITGYARGVVRRSRGSDTSFGKVIGSDTNGTVGLYSSDSESQIYDGGVGIAVLTDTTGLNGASVTVNDTTTQAAFDERFVFSADIGEWTWVADGKWPAINIGEIKLASDQPIEADDSVIALVDFDGRLNYEQEEHKVGLGLGGVIRPDSTPAKLEIDNRNVSISYNLTPDNPGTEFFPEPAIDGNGVITIDSTTNKGTANYTVRASADDYNIQEITLTITVVELDFEGRLVYPETAYEFMAGLEDIIRPDSTPTIPNFDTRVVSIRYSIAIESGMEFDPAPSIAEDSGIITIKPISTVGEAIYIVRASADDYPDQEVTLPITIIKNANEGKIQVSTYYNNVGETTDLLPVILGQAVADDSSTFVLADTDVVLTLSSLTNGDHLIHFGTVASGGANTYGKSYIKTVAGGTTTILKSELKENSFSFADGAVIGISGPDIESTQHVATYRSSNIYDHHDLQAMRKNLNRDYILKNDITFTPMTDDTGTVVSNYEAAGDEDTPFTGSLDGAGYAIVGIEIVSSENYQGLFRVMEASSVDTKAAQNLVLRDFKITGNAYVGSLAGWIKKGMVDNVNVEVSNADAGKVETGGNYGGGLLGLAGINEGGTEVRIQNTSSAVAVSRTGANSNQIGGLVGQTNNDVELTGSSATGSVTGNNRVGGLVGSNQGYASGYATGSVTGTSIIGGLVGSNYNNGVVTGYATGDMIATDDDVGGLVGFNAGTVTGYAEGNVTGRSNIGGLVGWNQGTATGYATGSVTGAYGVGGLVGRNNSGTLIGYARSVVQRSRGSELSFGKTIGLSLGGSVKTYSSADVSIFVAMQGEKFNGIEVSIASATEATFDRLDFGTDIGQWTWVEGGKWPAINIGDEIKPAAEQPLTSMP